MLNRLAWPRIGVRRQLRHDKRGNILMMFAFSLVPITFATGMAIDYTGAMRLQTRLNAVSDAAALSAVTGPMMRQPISEACRNARATFVSQAADVPGLSIDTAKPADLTITVTDTLPDNSLFTSTCPAIGVATNAVALPLSRTAAVTYKARSLNNFAKVLGRATLDITGTASSKTTVAPYIDIHLALDTSQSMGLAATDADAIKLWNATLKYNNRGCQFGCHSRDPKERYSMEEIARRPDVQARMRVDVLREATIEMIKTASDNQGGRQNYQFALYRIGKNAGRWGIGVDEYMKLTPDLASVSAKVKTLSLSENDGSVGFGDTDLTTTTSFILPAIKAQSASFDDGTSQARAKKYFFMVTDGVNDTEGNCNGFYRHCTGPITPATCDAYKQKGVTVGIVYTTYLPVRANPTPGTPGYNEVEPVYRDLVKSFAGQIKPSLEQCATSGWFFEASDGPSIHNAMQQLFRRATQTPSIIR